MSHVCEFFRCEIEITKHRKLTEAFASLKKLLELTGNDCRFSDAAAESFDYVRRIYVEPSCSLKKDIFLNLRWTNFIVRRLRHLNEHGVAVSRPIGNCESHPNSFIDYDFVPFSIEPSTLSLIFHRDNGLKESINLRRAFVASTYDLFDPNERNLSYVDHESIHHLHSYMRMRPFIFYVLNRMLDFVNMLTHLNKCRKLGSRLCRQMAQKRSKLTQMVASRYYRKKIPFCKTYRSYVELEDRFKRLRIAERFTMDLFSEYRRHERFRSAILYKE